MLKNSYRHSCTLLRLSLNFKLKAKHAQRGRVRHDRNWHSIDSVKKLQVEQQLTIVHAVDIAQYHSNC